MKNCIECNEPLDDDAKFCSECRAKQPEKIIEPEELKPLKKTAKSKQEAVTINGSVTAKPEIRRPSHQEEAEQEEPAKKSERKRYGLFDSFRISFLPGLTQEERDAIHKEAMAQSEMRIKVLESMGRNSISLSKPLSEQVPSEYSWLFK